jgi:CPA2 family monovalent cation:H+ antiporter-2
MGWSAGSGFVFGLSLSVASTVVLLRALQERRMVETEKGRIAVGWLIVEDLVMVLTLVLLPPLAGMLGGTAQTANVDPDLTRALGIGAVWTAVGVTALKVSAFIALMLVVGRKLIPLILHYVAHTGSRELFRLSVLAIALGVAYGSAKLFGVSFALGAFFAGMVLAESQLSQQAARETLPLRDAFAVLFFVSVGMLFDPVNLIERPLAIFATVLTIVFIKSAAAYLIVKAFGYPRTIALTIAASLAQIGEFSFILVVLGVGLDLLPPVAQDLVVAGALFSILVNPLIFMAVDRYGAKLDAHAPVQEAAEGEATAPLPEEPPADDIPEPTTLSDHAVVVGYGRVGKRIVEKLRAAGIPLLVIEERAGVAEALRESGIEAIGEPAGNRGVLAQANIAGARWFVTAIPDAFAAGTLIEQARSANGAISIVARATSQAEADHLRQFGANHIVIAKDELAGAMAEQLLALERTRRPTAEADRQGELNLTAPPASGGLA